MCQDSGADQRSPSCGERRRAVTVESSSLTFAGKGMPRNRRIAKDYGPRGTFANGPHFDDASTEVMRLEFQAHTRRRDKNQVCYSPAGAFAGTAFQSGASWCSILLTKKSSRLRS